MGMPGYVIKDALEYVRDIETNIPKHFWPELQRLGWMVLENDGTPNWNYKVTSQVSMQDLLALVKKSRAWNYFYAVTIHKPLEPMLKESDDSGHE